MCKDMQGSERICFARICKHWQRFVVRVPMDLKLFVGICKDSQGFLRICKDP